MKFKTKKGDILSMIVEDIDIPFYEKTPFRVRIYSYIADNPDLYEKYFETEKEAEKHFELLTKKLKTESFEIKYRKVPDKLIFK